MLKFPAAARVASMQSFCNLARRQKLVVLSGSGVFGASRVLSSRLAHHRWKHLHRLCYFSKSSFHSGAEGWTEELRRLSKFNDAMEPSTSSPSYDHSMNDWKSWEGEEPIGPEATTRRVNSSVDSSGGEETNKVLRYFDPVRGETKAIAAADTEVSDDDADLEKTSETLKFAEIKTSAAADTEVSNDDAIGEKTSGTLNVEDVNKVMTYFDRVQGEIMTGAAADTEVTDDDAVRKKTSRSLKRGGVRQYLGTEKREVNVNYSGVSRKSGKVRHSWVCADCGEAYGQWWGICRSCKATGSLKNFVESEVSKARGTHISEAVVNSWLPEKLRTLVPVSLEEVNNRSDQSDWRIPLSGIFGKEVSRVLGGGIVPGCLVLIGGDPGVGKSTLLLQIAAILAEGSNSTAPIVYVSGEESVEQIGNRASRMRIGTKDLFLYSSTDIEDILDSSKKLSPRALIVDSIQTVYLRGVAGSAGNVSQVKECTSALLQFAKQSNIPVLLIGHVTKTGDLAGPRMLEHIVDAVLYMEGERHSSYRLLRSVKNRFGSTDELGVFEMSESGLQAVSNPSELFLSENFSSSDILAGLAVAVIVDGSRAFLIEVQALCVSDTPAERHFNGLQKNRAVMIIAVLMKQAGLKLQEMSIFVNIVSGYNLTETAGDLATAVAICSSFLESPIPNDYAFIGEIGLGGELRAVPRMDKRVLAVAQLGFRKCIIPKTAAKSLKVQLDHGLEILACRNLKEVISAVFLTN